MRLRVSMATAIALLGMEDVLALPANATQQPTNEELARELAERRERERKRHEEVERLMLEYREPPPEHNIHYQPEPRRRSKRAQRAKARGW